jgi:hypothetical protein
MKTPKPDKDLLARAYRLDELFRNSALPSAVRRAYKTLRTQAIVSCNEKQDTAISHKDLMTEIVVLGSESLKDGVLAWDYSGVVLGYEFPANADRDAITGFLQRTRDDIKDMKSSCSEIMQYHVNECQRHIVALIKYTEDKKPYIPPAMERTCALHLNSNGVPQTCAIDEEDRERNSRCELIAACDGNMCRSDCEHYNSTTYKRNKQ